jgi:hypothetical protein
MKPCFGCSAFANFKCSQGYRIQKVSNGEYRVPTPAEDCERPQLMESREPEVKAMRWNYYGQVNR